jgi:hypothetical protein
MHHKSDSHHRKHQPGRQGSKPGTTRANRAEKKTTRGSRRRKSAGDETVDLLAHVCEVMGLFPREGDQALAEWIARMKAERQAGAAVQKSRRAGSSRCGWTNRRPKR